MHHKRCFSTVSTRKAAQESVRHPDADDTNVRTLIVELAEWCNAERGRQQEIANLFGVKRSAVNNWLAGRAVPSLRIGLGIQAFLARQRQRR
jgi:predicted XRE-type DNA-binding protein